MRDAIDHLQEEPRPRGTRQLTDEDNAWRIRVGQYRVIYEIQDDVLVVHVIRIAHPSKAYRGR
ncbi:MAG: type II toxin-antitoxin system RelE/ParE family toxin [Bacteroidetes bacterium]|nr:type II toxin-antitoxin system RelE/ParE family toxin [Bacteroidota bacterium]